MSFDEIFDLTAGWRSVFLLCIIAPDVVDTLCRSLCFMRFFYFSSAVGLLESDSNFSFKFSIKINSIYRVRWRLQSFALFRFVFVYLFRYIRAFLVSFSLRRRNSDQGSLSRLFSPLPTTVCMCLRFLSREDSRYFFPRRLE